MRVERPAAFYLRVGIDRVDLLAPGVQEAVVAGEEERVAEAVDPHVVIVAIHGPARDGIDDRESPAVHAAVPLAAAGAADRAVEADIGRDDPAVVDHPLAPGADVVEDPLLVAVLVGEHVGVERQVGGAQVQGVIADDVVVVLEVLEHLGVAVLAVAEPEPALDLDRVAGPVEGRRLAEQGAPAAVEQAADDLDLRIVIRRAGIVAQVEPGKARDPLPIPESRGSQRPSRLKTDSPSPWWNQSNMTWNSL